MKNSLTAAGCMTDFKVSFGVAFALGFTFSLDLVFFASEFLATALFLLTFTGSGNIFFLIFLLKVDFFDTVAEEFEFLQHQTYCLTKKISLI